jgi:hypothetical protein
MDDVEKAAELASLREHLENLESGAVSGEHGPGAPPPHNEREIARIRRRISELEADLNL